MIGRLLELQESTELVAVCGGGGKEIILLAGLPMPN